MNPDFKKEKNARLDYATICFCSERDQSRDEFTISFWNDRKLVGPFYFPKASLQAFLSIPDC